jgi:AcrR family transcriptional regulator
VSDEQILESMRQHVLMHGVQVSLDVVAADLGVTAPALLKRFGSRQALLVAALRSRITAEWVEAVNAGPTTGPLAKQLADLFAHISAYMHEAVPCVMALRESGLPREACFPDPRQHERGLLAVRDWLERARGAGLVAASELDAAAYAIIGALQTRAFFSHLMQRKTTKRELRAYAEDLGRFFARGLAASPAAPVLARAKAVATQAGPRKRARTLREET